MCRDSLRSHIVSKIGDGSRLVVLLSGLIIGVFWGHCVNSLLRGTYLKLVFL